MVVGWWQRRNTKKVHKVRMMSDCFIDGETKHFPGFFVCVFLFVYLKIKLWKRTSYLNKV